MTNPMSADYLQRFAGTARLYGRNALEQLARAHFAVIGLGGVGSWCAEALARTGLSELTLIDLDDICVSNTNRQLHTLQTTYGRPKIEVMAERLRLINPEIKVHCVHDFITRKNLAQLLDGRHQVIVDAMDSTSTKAALVAYCSAKRFRLVTVGSSGGKTDPTAVRVGDLGHTEGDPMLAKLRTQLYRHYNFTRGERRKFRVDAVYSPQAMVYPSADGTVCHSREGLAAGVRLDCEGGFGSSMMVTASFGLAAAAQAITRYLQQTLATRP